jgi:drug/metabolite transporter (DMT)-like permease
VISILAGLGTATLFAIGMLTAAQASRVVGPFRVVAWSAMVASILLAPFLLFGERPTDISTGQTWLLVLSGLCNILGFIFVYTALGVGKVGVVAPIVATQGAVTAVLAALTGSVVEGIVTFWLIVVILGVVIAARSQDPEPIPREQPVRAVLLATCGSVVFGISLLAIGTLSGELPIQWVLMPARLTGILLITLPLALQGKLRVPVKLIPILVLTGICDVGGITLYSVGAEFNVPVTAVVASQMAPLAAIFAYIVFRERLGRGQIAGIFVIIVGVSALSLLQ